jgi:hypothetical protein
MKLSAGNDIKFYLKTKMGGTPFTDPHSLEIFKTFNCFITNNIWEADFVVAHNHKKLLHVAILYAKKKHLVWTNEPRFDITFKTEVQMPFGMSKINIMNVYSNDVFWNNLHFLSSYHYDNSNNLGIDINKPLKRLTKTELHSMGKKHLIAVLFTNTISRNQNLIKGGLDIDLTKKRCEYAIAGHKRKLLHIYGNKWPDGYARDNSGFGFEKNQPWWIEKLQILRGYKFNLCFENTAYPYYVTEKIWHAIYAYSLPVYNSFNSTIYETFPENSFIDANLFRDENELFDYVAAMSEDEYLSRLNICIDVMNRSLEIKGKNYSMNANEVIKKIIDRLTIC